MKDGVVPVYVNNAFHWIMSYRMEGVGVRSLILVFDVKDEVFREIILPESLVNAIETEVDVKRFGDSSIAVIFSSVPREFHNSQIWVMKEYGVIESWVEYAKVGKRRKGKSTVLGFRKNGQLLVKFFRGQIALINQENKCIQNIALQHLGAHAFVDNYVESLVLFDKGNAVETRPSGKPKRRRINRE
ncbi:conserved hypothetical protein [Ricinus communis]|uniref:F-box associated beta-propeller type 1 domain-containing protein n=1 Tax=Ricinus communis TaxID=3988 RepID=B9SW11_RICCO|nr:conserved hypothetical protein [Ricinus communis]|eukprot:XP_025015066.1 uncharacterized protein LOC8271131 [Ricinus communis]